MKAKNFKTSKAEGILIGLPENAIRPNVDGNMLFYTELMEDQSIMLEDGEQQVLPDGEWEEVGFIDEMIPSQWSKVIDLHTGVATYLGSAYIFVKNLGIKLYDSNKWLMLKKIA